MTHEIERSRRLRNNFRNIFDLFTKHYAREQIKENEMDVECDKINAFNISFGKPERKRPLRIPGCRYEDNIKINYKETAWEIVH